MNGWDLGGVQNQRGVSNTAVFNSDGFQRRPSQDRQALTPFKTTFVLHSI